MSENLVRPFLPNDLSPESQVSAPAQQPELVRLIAGHGGGSPKIFNGSYDGSQTLYLKKIAREVINDS